MQKLAFLFLLLTFSLFACQKDILPDTAEAPITLSDVLAHGVKAQSDYDLLLEGEIYPFTKLSPAALREVKTGTKFLNGKLRAISGLDWLSELTLNEALGLLEIINHQPTRIENAAMIDFLPEKAMPQGLESHFQKVQDGESSAAFLPFNGPNPKNETHCSVGWEGCIVEEI